MKRLALPVALFREWNKLVRKFYNLYEQVVKLRAENSPLWHLRMLTERLKKTYKRLSRLQLKVGVKLAGTAIALMLATATLNAQDYTNEGRLVMYDPQGIMLSYSAPYFGDFDNDGDLDLFVGVEDGSVYLFFNRNGDWINGGKVTDGFGTPLDAGSYAVPAYGDVNGDGRGELFVGSSDGKIKVYNRRTGLPSSDFVLLGNMVVNDTVQVDVGYYAYPTLGDVDNDGDLDLVVGDYYGYLNLFINDGTGSFTDGGKLKYDDGTDINVKYTAHPAFADMDGDGDQDLIVSDYYGMVMLMTNNGSGQFAQPDTLLSYIGYYTRPALADADGDGDMDLYIGFYYGNISLYLNTNGSFSYDSDLEQEGSYVRDLPGANPVLADVDGDGDQDLCAGYMEGKVAFMKNVNGYFSPPVFLQDTGGNEIQVGKASSPAFADLDGDGDLDLYLGYYLNSGYPYYGFIRVFENTDTGFVDKGNMKASFNGQVQDIETFYYSNPAFGDLDGDGDLDLIVGTGIGSLRLFTNDGTNNFVDNGYLKVADTVPHFGYVFARPAPVDIDEDGDLDLVVGGDYHIFVLKNQGDGTFNQLDTLAFGSDIPNSARYSPTFGRVWSPCHQDLIVADFFSYFAVYKYKDTTAPVIACPGDLQFAANSDSVYVVQGTELDPVNLWDNCVIDSVYNSYNFDTTLAGATFARGDTTITWYVVDKAGLVDSCSFTVTITAPAGLHNPEFAVYPNPASDYAVITGATGWRVELLDLEGRTVIAPVEVNSGNFKLDLRHLQPGVYVLRLSNERAVETRRLMVR